MRARSAIPAIASLLCGLVLTRPLPALRLRPPRPANPNHPMPRVRRGRDWSDQMKKGMLRSSALISLAVAAAVAAGVYRPGGAASDRMQESAPAPRLVFLVEQTAGMSQDTSGVLLAGWTDGLVIFSLNAARPDQIHQCATIKPERIEWALQELKAAGFFDDHQEPGLAPDATTLTITANSDGKTVTHRCQERRNGPSGADADADPKV